MLEISGCYSAVAQRKKSVDGWQPWPRKGDWLHRTEMTDWSSLLRPGNWLGSQQRDSRTDRQLNLAVRKIIIVWAFTISTLNLWYYYNCLDWIITDKAYKRESAYEMPTMVGQATTNSLGRKVGTWFTFGSSKKNTRLQPSWDRPTFVPYIDLWKSDEKRLIVASQPWFTNYLSFKKHFSENFFTSRFIRIFFNVLTFKNIWINKRTSYSF